MTYPFFASSRRWPTLALAIAVLSCGFTSLLARPDPPAADRLMDPMRPENKDAPHLFFRSDAESTPSAGALAFKDFKNGPATFAEFCRQHPLDGKPPGQNRLTLLMRTDLVDASIDLATIPTPAQPTVSATDSLDLELTICANTQAETENILMLDRLANGAKMATPAWEGRRLFASLEQNSSGYTLSFSFAQAYRTGWDVQTNQPTLIRREVNNQISLAADNHWVVVPGEVQEFPATKDKPVRQLRTVLYICLF